MNIEEIKSNILAQSPRSTWVPRCTQEQMPEVEAMFGLSRELVASENYSIEPSFMEAFTFELYLLGMPIPELKYWILVCARLESVSGYNWGAACMAWSVGDFEFPKSLPIETFRLEPHAEPTYLQLLAAYHYGDLRIDQAQIKY
ncbi:MAG: hypothetical protein RLZZ519_1910, partial [Bacteroidota bacterium]